MPNRVVGRAAFDTRKRTHRQAVQTAFPRATSGVVSERSEEKRRAGEAAASAANERETAAPRHRSAASSSKSASRRFHQHDHSLTAPQSPPSLSPSPPPSEPPVGPRPSHTSVQRSLRTARVRLETAAFQQRPLKTHLALPLRARYIRARQQRQARRQQPGAVTV